MVSLADSARNVDYAFKDIPIIDLSNVSNNDDPIARKNLAEEIKNACMNVGFFYVKNHGVEESVIQKAFGKSQDFFALPLEAKMKIENKTTPNFKGYSPLLSGNNDPNNNGDLQEGFEFGWESLPEDDENNHDGAMAGANVWPEELPEFREAALKYYHAVVNLGKSLFPMFALALGLEEGFFDDKTKHSAALMRMLHYPPQTGPVDDRILGIGAHTEWCFTILWQEPGIQALQVLNAKKEWINAPPIPGEDLGDQLARWTNDIFKSTVHRAINRSGVKRYSIPLFFGTDYDVRLEPFPGCVTSERPMKYEVITAGEYVKSKLAATYGH
ncbi:Clavaminate synthase-like protein [Dendrothele bispora CBS 962.96]|uniref:Clavaminate synthase-like protein n=1 Tax=Dendrothele bispora (strain CBS 962.96) TaxID=1314807 RepID=A0A4S8MPP0_DENBC|nr:Clavaminate synthase-like protein [Dendrothele bispora CBS 962.96]